MMPATSVAHVEGLTSPTQAERRESLGSPSAEAPHPGRIGITTFGADRGLSGIGSYLKNLLEGFGQIPGFPATDLIGCPRDLEAFPASFTNPRTVSGAWDSPLRNVWWHQVGLPGLCRRNGYEVLFLPAANRRVPVDVKCPTVGTVHDFSSLHIRGKYDAARDFYIRRVLPALIRQLTLVVTPSESSKKDIVEYAGVEEDKVIVVPNGVDHRRFRPMDPEIAGPDLNRSLGMEGPYIVYVARLEHPGKNHVRLIRAFELLKNHLDLPHRLVLAGKDWNRAEEIHRAAAASKAASDILFTGHLDSALLPALYSQADLMVFPSLYEGFGLPVLEAMASGTPVACGSVSSLPEVGGEAAVYFDPLQEESMALAMGQVLGDPTLHGALREKGLEQSRQFTWEASARETLNIMTRAMKESG
jgi:glycosyltransferase involved in cell wall biosynthesis